MSAAKHTPGPWVHDTSGHPGPDVRAASGRAVAATWMVCKNAPKTAEGFKARQDEDRANARLIAAAPDLLAVAEQARRYLRAKNFDAGGRDAVAFILEAAIAKATRGAA